MGPLTTEDRLRAAMLTIAGLMAVGVGVELVLTEHYADPIQGVPFGLLGLGLGGIGAAAVSPSRATVLALRWIAALLVLGGAFGVWEHLEHNYQFEAEIRPAGAARTWLLEAVFGASPLLAPGAIAAIGLLAGAATLGVRAQVR